MVWGGGKYYSQNKKLPGVYNRVTTSNSGVSIVDRGVVAIGLSLDWGVESDVFRVTSQDALFNSSKLFGYSYSDVALKPIRDLFKHSKEILVYRLNSGGTNATATKATAKYGGTAGNKISVKIAQSIGFVTTTNEIYDVFTYFDGNLVDEQDSVSDFTALEANDFVTWNANGTLAVITETLSNGANGSVEGTAHQTFLNKLESYAFNILAYNGTDADTAGLYKSYMIRQRDEVGKLFGLVIPKIATVTIDHEGGYIVDNGAWAVPWFAGAIGGCAIGKSITAMEYDGEATGDTEYTAVEMEAVLSNGYICLHSVNDSIEVSRDLTNFTSVTNDKGENFKYGQVMRSLDAFLETVGVEFTKKCMGKEQNNASGRSTVYQIAYITGKTLQESYSALTNFTSESVVVSAGEALNAVVLNAALEFVGAMDTLYIDVKMA